MMFTKRNHLIFYLAFALLPDVLSVSSQRWQNDHNNVRGNSFGLENFLFHGYDEAEVNDAIKEVKRVPSTIAYKTTENKDVSKGTTRLKFDSPLKQKQQTPKQTIETIGETKGEESSSKIVPNRTRTRVVMRRRKRPYNNQLSEENADGSENKIPKVNRYSGGTLTSRITIRTTLSPTKVNDALKTSHSVRSTYVKPISMTSTPPTELSQEERIQQIEITKIAEHTTNPTPKRTILPEKAFTINLKDFLKQQTETLSLSELLQTQNLSLADLLRGNKDASAIFKAKQITSTLPTTLDVHRHTLSTMETITEAPSTITYKTKGTVKKSGADESVTTSMSSPKMFTKASTLHAPGNQKQEFNTTKEKEKNKTRKITLYTTSPLNTDAQNRINEFRTKLRNYQRKAAAKEPEVTNSTPLLMATTIVPPTIQTTNTTEAFSYKNKRIPYKSSNNPNLSLIIPEKKIELKEGGQPDRITNWTTSRLLHSKKQDVESRNQSENLISHSIRVPSFETTTKMIEDTFGTDDPPTFITTTHQKGDSPRDETKETGVEDDLVELLRSGHNAKVLQKILQSRNMTLQEVLSNREKSTVQSNIEELFSSQQTIVDRITEPTTGLGSSVKAVESSQKKPSEDLKNHLIRPHDDPTVESKINVVPNRVSKQYSAPVSSKREESVLNFKPDDLTADTSNNENLAVWKLSEKSIVYGSTFAHGGPLSFKHYTDRPRLYRTTTEPDDDIILLETLERNQDTARRHRPGLEGFPNEAKNSENEERSYIPPAVKSAIIASGVVMGIALFVFVAIFAACGWRQRRIRLRGTSSILTETLTRPRENTKQMESLTPVNFNDVKTYKKSLEFDDEDSESGTSFAGSYLWSTFKNTFTSRANTLKNRLEKEEKIREDKMTLRGNETKKKSKHVEDPERLSGGSSHDGVKRIDRTRPVINTSFNFKRSPTKDNVDYFSECSHRY